MNVECEMCGETLTYDVVVGRADAYDAEAIIAAHVDDAHDVVVSRDGSRGSYLISLFPIDAHDVLETPVPSDVREAIDTYDTGDALGAAMDTLVDYANELEMTLADAGFGTMHDDGYMIFTLTRKDGGANAG